MAKAGLAATGIALGLATASMAVAADAPKQLTLDQPTGAATGKCLPVDTGAVAGRDYREPGTGIQPGPARPPPRFPRPCRNR